MGLLRRAPRFMAVTGDAGGHHVFPGMLPALEARDDMVDSQRGLAAAVLADEAVAVKDSHTCQFALHAGTAHHVVQLDYRRYGISCTQLWK